MLEKPDLPDAVLLEQLAAQYGLPTGALTFLPLGADANTAVYRFEPPGGAVYFVKLRQGDFDPLSVEIPHFLHAHGLSSIIPILETAAGRLWSHLPPFTLILYPFIAGLDGYTQEMSPENWLALGRTLHAVHTAQLPTGLLERLPRETFSPRFRRRLHGFLAQVQSEHYDDPISARLAAAMHTYRAEIVRLLERANRLARGLQSSPPEFGLCHADVHPGNVHLTPDGRLYLVDWDAPMLAPKEHDLMAIGAGFAHAGNERSGAESGGWGSGQTGELFYDGYGYTNFSQPAITYYRCERIIQDIVAECELVLFSQTGDDDREREVGWFLSNFQPGGVYDQAVASNP